MGKQVLGRGLSALIPDFEPSPGREGMVMDIAVSDIQPNPYQPRMHFDAAALSELKRSILEQGVIQPVVVRRLEGGYQIIAGERRWRAVREAGLDTIPALVRDVSSAEDMIELSLVENIQRENLNPIDEANAYRTLMKECDLTQEEVAQKVGKDRSTVANLLRLLRLPDAVQEHMLDGELTMGHARALLVLDDESEQIRLCEEILKNGWSVRKAESTAKARGSRKPVPAHARAKHDPLIEAVEEELQRFFATGVRIVRGGKKGTIEIEFYSDRDLERVLGIFRGER
ncbi:MAG: ParB/RepB/Spo0J family partition protein [Candidatus Latescibacterota bacterium]